MISNVGLTPVTLTPVALTPVAIRSNGVNAFVFEAVTAAADETFTLPLEASGTYDFAVDWGDGNTDNINVYNDPAVTHTYASTGTHVVSITGTINGWRFNNGGDKLKIHDIKSWGPLLVGNSGGYFYGCSNLTCSATDTLDTSNVTNMSHMFRGCSAFNQSVSNFDTSNVTNMTNMFYSCSSFNQSVSNFDTSAVTNMSYMFYGCSAFNQSVSNFDTSNVTIMYAMFFGCSSFNGLVNFDTSNVTNMAYMLQGCSSFDQSLADFSISSVTGMSSMLVGVTLSTANYDSLLTSWEAQAVKDNVVFHGGNSKYSAGAAATARAALIADHGWTITDGGPA